MSVRSQYGGEPKYIKTVRISIGAAMKMSQHSTAGVEKGMRGPRRMPTEVMGLLFGHVDPDSPRTVVITDAAELPVEGTETSVLADNPLMNVYFTDVQESHAQTHPGSFVTGWYHSHPFEVGSHSNAFLSQTDVSSQNGYQISEDNHYARVAAQGGAERTVPFIAIVVDPLRSAAKGRPEIGAFRCLPQVSSRADVFEACSFPATYPYVRAPLRPPFLYTFKIYRATRPRKALLLTAKNGRMKMP